MELPLRIYTVMPSVLKRLVTLVYIRVRKAREARAARMLGRSGERPEPYADGRPRVCYLSGFPRSGTTMLKYYFGSHPGLMQTAFTTRGFTAAWGEARGGVTGDAVLIDKSNHYIYSLENIFRACGDAVKVCIIVRDPRDSLVSFAGYGENREVPRDAAFWNYWARQHRALLAFAERSAHGRNVFVLRYEDLVRFPEHAKAAFLTWLGMVTAPDEVTREYTNQNPGEGWDDSVHRRRMVSDYAIQKWTRTEVPEAMRRLTGGWRDYPEAREMMHQFGYDASGYCQPRLENAGFVFFREPEPAATDEGRTAAAGFPSIAGA